MAAQPRTIPRSATRKIAQLRATLTACRSYSLSGNFSGAPVDPAEAWTQLASFRPAKLIDNGDGTYTVRLHSNHWFTLSAGRGRT